LGTRRREADSKVDDDVAVVDALVRQLRANSRVPAPALTTAAPAAALRSPGPDAGPRPRVNTPALRPTSRARRIVDVWARVALGVVVALAVPQWPYERSCGVELLVYLFAVTTVFVTGVWGATASWRGRIASAHVVALCTILWGLTLAALEVLPRSDVNSPVAWRCAPFHGAPHPALPIRLDPASRPPA
jgi:hypothetical protein